jgi:hypothetical protein
MIERQKKSRITFVSVDATDMTTHDGAVFHPT